MKSRREKSRMLDYEYGMFTMRHSTDAPTPFSNDNNLYVLSLALKKSYNETLDIVSRRGQLDRLENNKDISPIVFLACLKIDGWRGLRIQQDKALYVQRSMMKIRPLLSKYYLPLTVPYVLGRKGQFALVDHIDEKNDSYFANKMTIKSKIKLDWGEKTMLDSVYVPENSQIDERMFWEKQMNMWRGY